MNRFGENSRNLLRKGAMLRGCAPTKRLFQFIRYISTDEDSFTVDHLFSGAPVKSEFRLVNKRTCPLAGSEAQSDQQRRQETFFRFVPGKVSKSVSRILYSDFRFQILNLGSQI
jgi:hypothetical protein